MANNSRVSRSTSLEDLREKNVQIEADLSKLAEEVREVVRKQDESSKRQEESHRRLEENSRALDDKLGNLSSLMERALRQMNGKGNSLHIGESSDPNGRNRQQVEGHSRIHGVSVERGMEEEEPDPAMNMTAEEFEWTAECRRNRERTMRHELRRGHTNMQLPRIEFPQFDGGDPKRWKMNCDFYFEMYEVPEAYKTRMAIMNFSEDMHEWYRCLTVGGHPLPWELLVEEVMARFQGQNMKNPVDEFKRIHQIGKVDEFIRRFDRMRARLLLDKPNLDEEFFVAGFISGLKEELKHTVELFNPKGLNNAFHCALKVEAAQEMQNRKPKELSKGFKYQKNQFQRTQKMENERPEGRDIQAPKQWQQKPYSQSPNYEQRKALGLCHKCHGKY